MITSRISRGRALMLSYWWSSASVVSSDTDVSPQWLMGQLALSFFTKSLAFSFSSRSGASVAETIPMTVLPESSSEVGNY